MTWAFIILATLELAGLLWVWSLCRSAAKRPPYLTRVPLSSLDLRVANALDVEHLIELDKR